MAKTDSDFVPLRSMTPVERKQFKQGIESLLKQAKQLGLKLTGSINGEVYIATQLHQRKRGEGLRFMGKKDLNFGSQHFGKNPPW